MNEKRLKCVLISPQVLTELVTVGWTTQGRIIECVEGLPNGASFLGVSMSLHGDIQLLYEHYDFPLVELTDDMQNIPIINVVLRTSYIQAEKEVQE